MNAEVLRKFAFMMQPQIVHKIKYFKKSRKYTKSNHSNSSIGFYRPARNPQ